MLRSISLYTGARIINGVAALALLSLLTSTLSPDAYGAYALLFTFSTSLATIAYQWISVSIFRFNNPENAQRAALYSEAVRLYLIVCSILVVVAPTVLYAALPDLFSWPKAVLLVALTLFAGMVDMQLNFATSSGKPARYVMLTSGRAILTLFLVGVMLWAGYDEFGALLAVTGSYFLAASIGVFNNRALRSSVDPDMRRRILRYGLPLSVSIIATIVIDFSDRFMLAIFANLAQVGMYSAAYNLSQQTTGALLAVIFVTIFPRITMAYENEDAGRVVQYASMLLLLLLGLGGMILTGFAWYSAEVSALILGSEIGSDAATLMPIVSLAIVFGALKANVFDVPSKLAQHTNYLLIIAMIMAGINVLLNLVLIPTHGAYGAAFATLITFLIGLLSSMIRNYRFWKISLLYGGLLKLLGALVSMNIFIYFADSAENVPWVIGAVSSILVYCITFYFLNPLATLKDR
jgi:O-antigen/teichoic acid export membrane protein